MTEISQINWLGVGIDEDSALGLLISEYSGWVRKITRLQINL